jgi:hypothetical protein
VRQATLRGHFLLLGLGVGMSALSGHFLLLGLGVGMSATNFAQSLFESPAWDILAVLPKVSPARPVISKDVNNKVLIILLFGI